MRSQRTNFFHIFKTCDVTVTSPTASVLAILALLASRASRPRMSHSRTVRPSSAVVTAFAVVDRPAQRSITRRVTSGASSASPRPMICTALMRFSGVEF